LAGAIIRVMEVDAATRRDADAVAAIFGAARRAAMPWLPRLHSDAEDRRYFAEHVIGECDVLVVRRERLPVAFLALRNDMVEHLYVRPDVQRAGIGSALLEVARNRSPSGLRLWVFQRNHRARAFYARHGFAEVRFTDGSDNEEHEPDVLLAWKGRPLR
jgi:GNAT superfamily N-acetyltransferase